MRPHRPAGTVRWRYIERPLASEGRTVLVVPGGPADAPIAALEHNTPGSQAWRAGVTALDVFQSPGNHMTMLSGDGAAALAAWLARRWHHAAEAG